MSHRKRESRPLEPDLNAGPVAEIALVVVALGEGIAKAGQQIVKLSGPDGDPVGNRNIDSTASENGLLLGLFPEATYSFVEVPLEPGDKAILYTDGILEARSPSEQEFGPDLLKGFLDSSHNLKANAFADLLLDELTGWSEHPKGDGQGDDITLLVIDFLND
jgi:hypothetical protein